MSLKLKSLKRSQRSEQAGGASQLTPWRGMLKPMTPLNVPAGKLVCTKSLKLTSLPSNLPGGRARGVRQQTANRHQRKHKLRKELVKESSKTKQRKMWMNQSNQPNEQAAGEDRQPTACSQGQNLRKRPNGPPGPHGRRGRRNPLQCRQHSGAAPEAAQRNPQAPQVPTRKRRLPSGSGAVANPPLGDARLPGKAPPLQLA